MDRIVNSMFALLRGLYDWVLAWADSPYATVALFVIAFTESSFFPIPPDVLLLALALSRPKQAFRYALICTLGSVSGAAFGYLIGLGFYESVGRKIIALYGAESYYLSIQRLYRSYDALAVMVAGFTPIPFKVATIAAGVFEIDFVVFMLAALASRGARFYLLSLLVWRFGPPIRVFIERYFNLLTVIFFVMLVGGFFALQLLFK